MNGQCAFLKDGGGRCRGIAIRGSDLCAAHDPTTQERRRQGAVRGGKTRPGAAEELRDVKRQLQNIADGVLTGEVATGRAAVAVQALNAKARVLEIERRSLRVAELEAELDRLLERGA